MRRLPARLGARYKARRLRYEASPGFFKRNEEMSKPSFWWRPQAHAKRRQFLVKRAAIAQAVRAFFVARDFIEVDTAALQISPGNEIYLVYNRNWERRWDPLSRFAPLEERGVIKITLSVRP